MLMCKNQNINSPKMNVVIFIKVGPFAQLCTKEYKIMPVNVSYIYERENCKVALLPFA